MRLKNSLSCFFFLWLFLASGITQAQGAETKKLPSLTPIWDDLDSLLTELSQEALKQSKDLESLSTQLQQSQTEISELQSSLKQLEQQLQVSEQSMNQLYQQMAKVERERTIWKWVAIISSSLAAGCIVVEVVR